MQSRLAGNENLTLSLSAGGGDLIPLPGPMANLLLRIASEIAEGNNVTLLADDADLTENQAANLLGVSRPYLVELLNRNELPHRPLGGQRRISFADLLAYKKRSDAHSDELLKELAAEAQELNLGYE